MTLLPTPMSTTPDLQLARIRGCILGGALGDAIGLFTEFFSSKISFKRYPPHPPSTLPHLVFTASSSDPLGTHTMFPDAHRTLFGSGSWTDDTDHSLLILLSFLRSFATSNPGTLDQWDFATRLRNWVDSGLRALDRLPLDVGMTISGVVRSASYLDDPVGAAKE
jgi:ADP-ribosylglycohydrolase